MGYRAYIRQDGLPRPIDRVHNQKDRKLPRFDTNGPGSYMVTVCTKGRDFAFKPLPRSYNLRLGLLVRARSHASPRLDTIHVDGFPLVSVTLSLHNIFHEVSPSRGLDSADLDIHQSALALYSCAGCSPSSAFPGQYRPTQSRGSRVKQQRL